MFCFCIKLTIIHIAIMHCSDGRLLERTRKFRPSGGTATPLLQRWKVRQAVDRSRRPSTVKGAARGPPGAATPFCSATAPFDIRILQASLRGISCGSRSKHICETSFSALGLAAWTARCVKQNINTPWRIRFDVTSA